MPNNHRTFTYFNRPDRGLTVVQCECGLWVHEINRPDLSADERRELARHEAAIHHGEET